MIIGGLGAKGDWIEKSLHLLVLSRLLLAIYSIAKLLKLFNNYDYTLEKLIFLYFLQIFYYFLEPLYYLAKIDLIACAIILSEAYLLNKILKLKKFKKKNFFS